MACSRLHGLFTVPLLLLASSVLASEEAALPIGSAAFELNPAELYPMHFTRSRPGAVGVRADTEERRSHSGHVHGFSTRHTEVSFKLKPKLPEFSRKGAYGLDLFEQPRLDVYSRLPGSFGLHGTISELNDGLFYSAGVRIEHEDEDIDGTAYVSSSMLGLSYGRLGRLWYGGIDVNLEQFDDDSYGEDQPDVLSLDVTTGRRFGFTGLSKNSPLWLLSVQGNLELVDEENEEDADMRADWYLNPSLFWQQPGFTFSAQMQLPVEFETMDDTGKPDYRLRAVFEKHFQ